MIDKTVLVNYCELIDEISDIEARINKLSEDIKRLKKRIEDIENGTTAIKTLNVDTMKAYAAEGWYTLDGIKLQNVPTEKGVYIQNGKKVVIK